MRVADFDFELDPLLIAQSPARERDASRLLVLDRETGATRHRTFSELPDLLRAGDLLVLNDTRVIPARLIGRKPSGGRVELLLSERVGAAEELWSCLLRASRKPGPGTRIDFDGELTGEIVAKDGDLWQVRLRAASGDVASALNRVGRMPLPPYIERSDAKTTAADRERYQTVYAEHPGAVAAPTAGLHFTAAGIQRLRAAGVEIATLTLHVGPGTFRPVRSVTVEEHRLGGERFVVPRSLAASVAQARRRNGRVVAVGTTVVRTLESLAETDGGIRPGSGTCTLFIYPGHGFRVVDALITNFHLPRSTLLMLVSAFAGRERVLAAYAEAMRERYRFYSYGDAMLVQ
jgi:S-adenosylmethionine:tRNA ribosyltransferase-isomerase